MQLSSYSNDNYMMLTSTRSKVCLQQRRAAGLQYDLAVMNSAPKKKMAGTGWSPLFFSIYDVHGRLKKRKDAFTVFCPVEYIKQ